MEGTQEVSTRALTIVEQANAVVIRTSENYTAAGALWKAIKDLKTQVNDTFKPIIEKAHAAHKEALAQKAKIFDPLDAASKTVKGAMEKYDREQEAIRLAEEKRLREIAEKEEAERRRIELERLEAVRKAEEDRLMEAAAAAEKAGDAKRAEELAAAAVDITEDAKQEAAVIAAEPVYVPPVVIPKTVPKVSGGPVYRTIIKFRIINESAIPRQYMMPNEVKIGQVVRALKKETNIPGIEIYEERV